MRFPLSFLTAARLNAATLALLSCAVPAARAAHPTDAETDLTTVPLEQLMSMEVFSTARFAQRASEAPSSVTIITAADIRAHGWRTLADVARSVRGLHVNYDRTYSYVGGRGFLRPGDYNTRFLLLVNGSRINDAVYDLAPMGGEFPLELDLVERIEVAPGPGSSSYGSNAFFGVINVITKHAGDPAANRISAEAGSFGARKGVASTAWRNGSGTAVLLSASRHLSDGADQYYPEYHTPDQNNGVAERLDYERGARLFASVAHGPFSATLIAARRIKGMPTAAYMQAFNDPRARTIDRQAYVNLTWRDDISATEEVVARAGHGHYDAAGDYALPDLSDAYQVSQARWMSSEITLASTRFRGHKLAAGIDLQRNYDLRQLIRTSSELFPDFAASRRTHRSAVYIEDEMALGASTLLNIGLRHDHNSGTKNTTSPRVALIHQLGGTTTVKAIHGTAFRAPNSFEANFSLAGSAGQRPAPDLRKERIRSSELALVQRLGGGASLTAIAFNNEVDDLVTLFVDPRLFTTRFDNAAPARARGLEVEYERKWASGAALRTSFSRTRTSTATQPLQPVQGMGMGPANMTIDPSSNPPNVNSPGHMVKLNAIVPFAAGWTAAIEAQYLGPRQTLAGRTGGYTVANLNLLSRRLFDRVDLSLGVSNLFDRSYADPSSTQHLQAVIPQDGRTYRIKAAYAY